MKISYFAGSSPSVLGLIPPNLIAFPAEKHEVNMKKSWIQSLFLLLIYTLSALRCQPRRDRCVFSCKMRLAFILTVNLCTTDDPPSPLAMFSHVKCALYQLPQMPCVFSGKMRLAFAVTVNS